MMVLWTEATLTQATGGIFYGATHLPSPLEITGISIDTRTLLKGDLFIALKGETHDGHAHIPEAFAKGAACVMAEHIPEGIAKDYPVLVVEHTQVGLEKLAFFARQRFKGTMLAVTGSVGKTTTKNMLKAMLSTYGLTHAAEASYNNHIGVPLTLARLPMEARFAICEIGMNHIGEIHPLAQLVQPDIAIITTIASAHIGHMGSLKAIAQEKASLLSSLRKNGVAFVAYSPEFLPLFRAALPTDVSEIYDVDTFIKTANLYAENVHATPKGSRFDAHLLSQTLPVELHYAGMHLVYSALICLAVAECCSLPLDKALKALSLFTPGEGRGNIYSLDNGDILLIDESYNASSLSIQNSLKTLGLYKNKRHIAILGDIRELGTFSKQEHESLAPDITATTDIVFCAGPEMKNLYKLLPSSIKGSWQPDAASLIADVIPALKKGDVVLVKGSHASRMADIVKSLLQHYSSGVIV